MTKVTENSYELVAVTYVAGDEGLEPPIMGPEPIALPLGQSPLAELLETTEYLTREDYTKMYSF